MTDVSLFLCCWSFTVYFAQGLKIHKMDFTLMEQRSRGIVVLHETKSVQRTASSETMVIFNAYLVRTAAFQAKLAQLVPKLDSQSAAGNLTASGAVELPHISICSQSVGSHHGPRKVGIRQGSTALHWQCNQRTCCRMSAKSHHGD